MTDLSRPSSTAAARRPGVLPVLLWALLAISVTGNAVASAGVGPGWLGIALGAVTAVCAGALVLLHLRRR